MRIPACFMGDKLLKHSSLGHRAACSWEQEMIVPGFITEMLASSSSEG